MEFDQTSILLTIGIIGLVLMVRGWRRRVSDGGLYCAKCGYRVDAGASGRCAECGVELVGAAVTPWRSERDRTQMLIGSVLAIIAGSVLGARGYLEFNRVNINPWLPSWVLLRTDVVPINDPGEDAVMELRNREAVGRMGEGTMRGFSELLAVRATELNRTAVRGAEHFITGSTIHLWNTYKPPDEIVDPLLDAILARQAASVEPSIVNTTITPDGPAIILRDRPYLPFRYPHDRDRRYPVFRIRPTVLSVEVNGVAVSATPLPWRDGQQTVPLPSSRLGDELKLLVQYDWLMDKTDEFTTAQSPTSIPWWIYWSQQPTATAPTEDDPLVTVWHQFERDLTLIVAANDEDFSFFRGRRVVGRDLSERVPSDEPLTITTPSGP